MIERDTASTTDLAPTANLIDISSNPASASASSNANPAETKTDWQVRNDLAWHRAETERVKVLVEFLSRPIHAHGGTDPDPDIITAYNLAIEAALQGIRRATAGR